MANVLLAGTLLTGAGVAVVGATVEVFDRDTTTPARATFAGGTDASGDWNFSYAPGANARRVDVRITNGSSISFLKYDDQIQVSSVETANLRIINPAFTFEYDIVPAAITAARQLNLPLLTGTATLAAIDEGVKGADIASGATLTLVAGSDFADVTGTTTVTAISTRPAGSRFTFQFDGALTLTHNATTLILQGAVNLVTAAGDVLTFISEGGGNWREESRRLAAAAAAPPARATQAALEAETDEETYASPNRVKFSPGVAKAYCGIAAAGTLNAGDYNVASVTDTGVGDRTIVWDVDFADALYVVTGSVSGGTTGFLIFGATFAVGSVRLQTADSAGNLADRDTTQVAFGDQ
mgnify:CR=1 FL=1